MSRSFCHEGSRIVIQNVPVGRYSPRTTYLEKETVAPCEVRRSDEEPKVLGFVAIFAPLSQVILLFEISTNLSILRIIYVGSCILTSRRNHLRKDPSQAAGVEVAKKGRKVYIASGFDRQVVPN